MGMMRDFLDALQKCFTESRESGYTGLNLKTACHFFARNTSRAKRLVAADCDGEARCGPHFSAQHR